MNWELVILGVTGGCAAVICWEVFARLRGKRDADGQLTGAPPYSWLEIAYPLGFIATMGLLVVYSVMSFAAILLLATTITGIIWLLDKAWLARKRASGAEEPVVVEMAKSFFPVILVVFLLRSFVAEPFKIPSGSMLPGLLVGDFILVNKYTYGVRLPVLNKKIVEVNSPQRGDVMVFRYPVDPSKDFIKRVIGLPGDVVSYKNKRLAINGQVLSVEPVGTFAEVDERGGFMRYDTFTEKFGEKKHTIMTNPERPTLLGLTREFPYKKNCEYNEDGLVCTVPPGHFLMMGDNRDNSDDGRYWGFVPEENIVGKAFLVWMNFGQLKRIFTSIE